MKSSQTKWLSQSRFLVVFQDADCTIVVSDTSIPLWTGCDADLILCAWQIPESMPANSSVVFTHLDRVSLENCF